MYGSYATHSASVCFNGGVKVKRQPWNILSLTSLQLLLCNFHVIVWQRGEKTAYHNMLFYNIHYQDWLKPLSLIVMLEHRVLMPSFCAHRWNYTCLPTAFTGPLAGCSPSPPTPASELWPVPPSLSGFPHSSTRQPWKSPVITPDDWLRGRGFGRGRGGIHETFLFN